MVERFADLFSANQAVVASFNASFNANCEKITQELAAQFTLLEKDRREVDEKFARCEAYSQELENKRKQFWQEVSEKVAQHNQQREQFQQELKKNREEIDEKVVHWKNALHQLEVDKERFQQEQRLAEEQLMTAEAELQKAWQVHEQNVSDFNIRNDMLIQNAALCLALKDAKLEQIRSSKKQPTVDEKQEAVPCIVEASPEVLSPEVLLVQEVSVESSGESESDDVKKDEDYAPARKRIRRTRSGPKKSQSNEPAQNPFVLTNLAH